MMTYSVIIGSPPGGSILPSGAFGSLGWLTNASTPAERLNIAFRFGNAGRASKSGCMKARYSISASLPASGQMRISRSGSFSAKVSRHAFAVPIRLSRSTMSSAIFSPIHLSSPPRTRGPRANGKEGCPRFPLARRAVRGTGQRIVAARQAPPRFGGILLVEETQKGVLGVRYQNTVFGSLLKAVPRRRFSVIVERHGGDKYVKGFLSLAPFVTLVSCQ